MDYYIHELVNGRLVKSERRNTRQVSTPRQLRKSDLECLHMNDQVAVCIQLPTYLMRCSRYDKPRWVGTYSLKCDALWNDFPFLLCFLFPSNSA